MHTVTYKDDDIVDIGEVIHDVRYCVSQKASLCTKGGRVSVLVKSCHGMYNIIMVNKFIFQQFVLCSALPKFPSILLLNNINVN